jgi:hippurate hydrolase
MIEQRMRSVAEHTCAAFDATCEFHFLRNYPPTVNHSREARFVREVMQDVAGEARTHTFEPTMGAEDFSFFLQALPGAYFMIGNGDGSHRAQHGLSLTANAGPCTLHNPHYDFNDALIPTGAALWVRLVQRWFSTP